MRETEHFEVVPRPDGWAVKHGPEESGPYETKQAAFEAVATLVENLIAQGEAVEIRVPAGGPAGGD